MKEASNYLANLTYQTDDFSGAISAVTKLLVDFIDRSRLSDGPVVNLKTVSDVTKELRLKQFVELAGGQGDPGILGEFVETYLPTLIRLNDPRFIGHQVSRPHFASALADLVNGMTNNGMAVYEMGPGPVAIERFVVQWLLGFVNWPDGGDGFLTHGGSLANLTALLAARGTFHAESWREGIDHRHVFLVPETSHYCLQRAICILGYGARNIRFLPTNDLGRIEVDQIESVFQAAVDEGNSPVAICANACSTPTGLYDDLKSIGEFAKQKSIWFHVDAAHGGSALVSQTHRELLHGIQLADSVVWDQHKLLQTSALCTAVLFRNPESLNRIFQQHASYLNATNDDDFPNLFHQTIECTKVPIGLKFYLCLLAIGKQGFADFVDALFSRTEEIYRLISSRDGFLCRYKPQSNILCFQYRPEEFDPFAIRDQIIREGEFYFTRTELKGEKYFRFTVTSPETSNDIVSRLLDRIEETAG